MLRTGKPPGSRRVALHLAQMSCADPFTKIGNDRSGFLIVFVDANKFAVRTEQEEGRRMPHSIAVGCRGFLDLLVVDLEGLGSAFDLVRRSAQPKDSGTKLWNIVSQSAWCIPFRVDRDEKGLDGGTLGAELV